MASGTLINDTTLHKDFTIDKQTGTVLTLAVNNSYVDKSIVLGFDVQTDAIAVKGAALNNKSANATFTNMTTSSTNTSGVEIQTKGSAGRDAILLDGAVAGWVSGADGSNLGSAISVSTWDGTKYYATGVTLTAGKAFDITVPNGSSSPVTFHFAVDASGNTTITGGE